MTTAVAAALTISPFPLRSPTSVRSARREVQLRAAPVESWLAAVFQNPNAATPRPPTSTTYESVSGVIRHPAATTAPATAPQSANSIALPLAALTVQARIAPSNGSSSTESCWSCPGF